MAISLNGTNQAFRIGFNLPLLNNASTGIITAWVRPPIVLTSLSTVCAIAIGPPPGVSNSSRLSLRVNASGNLEIGSRRLDGDAGSSVTSTTPLDAGVWQHIGCVMDWSSDSGLIYKNGVLVFNGPLSNSTAGNTSATNTKVASIGCGAQGNAEFFRGEIEDVRLYSNVVFGDKEMSTMTAAKGRDGITTGLTFRYQFNGGESVVVGNEFSIAEIFRGRLQPTNSPTFSGSLAQKIRMHSQYS